jgi:radical SAM superfamily enzyme YgiQ (UPF0313 family)
VHQGDKLRIYLLNPPFKEGFVRCGRWQGGRARGKTFYYPIWLAYACGALDHRGYDVRLVDAVARKWTVSETLDDISKFNPSLLVVDTNFSSIDNDVQIAIDAKTGSENRLVTAVVGPPTAVYANDILGRFEMDFVVRKEFDHIIPEIAEAIEGSRESSSILGISYRRGNDTIHNPDRPFLTSEELDQLPFVSSVYKKHLNVNDYWLDHTRNPMVQIITSRGCPNLCTFCSWPENLHGRRFRARSATNVADEVEWILDNMGDVKEIFFEDDSFTIDTKRVVEFTQEVRRRRLKFVWSCQTRATLDLPIMQEMKEAGCRLLDVGFESGSDTILSNVKKGVTVERTKMFAKQAKEARLLVLGDFVFGFPGETKQTIEMTRQLIREMRPSLLQIAIATPIPGTDFYDWTKEHGYLTVDNVSQTIDSNGFQKSIISYPGLSSRELEKAVKETLLGYYLSPRFVAVALRNIIVGKGIDEITSIVKSAARFLEYAGREG